MPARPTVGEINASGQLGDNSTTARSIPTAVQQGAVTYLINYCWLFTHLWGDRHRHWYCWGNNSTGQLGDNSATQRLTPVTIAGGLSWGSVVSSEAANHTCGVKISTQLVYCWGNRIEGKVGDNTGYALQQTKPVAVQQGGVSFVSVATGAKHTCGLTNLGAAYCWGLGANGRLGDNTYLDRYLPVPVQQGAVVFTSLTVGNAHTCGLTSLGAAYCWGYNGLGQLGDNSTSQRPAPVAVQQGAVTFTSIAAGRNFTCGLTSAGATYCWGFNGNGQLGDNTTTQRLTPVAVQQGATTFASIAAGENHACGITSGGAGYCWGYNGAGQLGDNSTTQRLTPVTVQQGAVTFASITAGGLQTCGLTNTGAGYCWGDNGSGRLGDNTTTRRLTPVAVQQGAVTFASIAAGAAHACGLTSAGMSYCWGNNGEGQVGDNTTTDRLTPVGGVGWTEFLSVTSSAGGQSQLCSGWHSGVLLGFGCICPTW